MSQTYASPETLAVLEKARELIARPGGWCQHISSRDADGFSATYQNSVQFCAAGAVERFTHPDSNAYQRLKTALEAALPKSHQSLTCWNDAPSRKQHHVVALYDRAIADVRALLEVEA